MTQTEIIQATEQYLKSIDRYGLSGLEYIEKENREEEIKEDFVVGAKTALTHGWNSPDVVPEPDRDLVYLVWDDEYFITPGYSTFTGKMVDKNLNSMRPLAWRYNNAQDIYELLKQNGTI